ncbi:hypothetical protein QLQ15_02645 [Lysobacter sp. LF1]|uniref:Uncharacterized protein n=1 Tax=Lysobacter stagni TaxID=3045172 RepID=A0ABT6XCD4_9GAMM|nr:hypothetical protein [Lysobacter sp. LF1]MDI9237809.1 hypothetical protein [Lysobacter sp. LF1]
MRSFVAILLGCVLSVGAAQAADQAEVRAHYLDMRVYGLDGMYDYFVDACRKAAPARAVEMEPALAAWRTEQGAAIERGGAAMGRLFPDMGKTDADRRATIHASNAKSFDAEIAADPDRSCWRALQSIRFSVPMEFSGTTLTDRNLRHDVFKQAFVGASALSGCRDFDALEASVVSDTGTGAERRIEERWLFKGCGKEQPATVTHGPAPAGGTNFVVSFKNPASAQP